MTPAANDRKIRVMLEMRPALEGYAGIPQETRLLFRGLRMIDNVEVEGLIQASHLYLENGTKEHKLLAALLPRMTHDMKMNRYSRVIISTVEKPYSNIPGKVVVALRKYFSVIWHYIAALTRTSNIKLTRFESEHFRDFVWSYIFSKTLHSDDYNLVTGVNFKVCALPWQTMHRVGLKTISAKVPRYPSLNTKGVDIFISQTPYPATISSNTAMVVRYHDAIPMLMPHTIPEKSIHQATHYYAIKRNIADKAHFACVSESTRKDLTMLFPQAEERSVTIHNMVSHNYYTGDPKPELVYEIVRSRLNHDIKQPAFLTMTAMESFYKQHLKRDKLRYLLMVSTIEPRKNHKRLLSAWEAIWSSMDNDLKLIIVGALGWNNDDVVKGLKSWIDRGQAYTLSSVPSPSLRVLYANAAATVCPSLGEGFDFSGIEAMASGGVVVASDIPVHREIYGNASVYFNPNSTSSLVGALKKVLYADDSAGVREQLRKDGARVSSLYKSDVIMPKWREYLRKVHEERIARA